MKINRYILWLQALHRANLSARQWLNLLSIPFTERRVTKAVWRRRMTACCHCPIYNRKRKTCMKCDCFMPIKAAFAEQECAGEIEGNLSARGWSKAGYLAAVEELVGRRLTNEEIDARWVHIIRQAAEAGQVEARGADGSQIINDQQKENDE